MPTTPSSPTLDDFASLLRGYRPSTPQESLGSDFLRSQAMAATNITTTTREEEGVLLILLPLLIVLSTVLFLILVFLVCVILLKRKRGIKLGDDGGPVDLSHGDGVYGEGGVEGVESRWLESQEEDVQRGYRRAKDWQLQYPPSSVPTDITLSQFLSIQEKGVSAWSFEPDYESNPSLFVQSRTEITFLADGPGMPAEEGGGNSVMANLPLPKLNDVYYWECKMYEKPEGTDVAVGLATKPFPTFRLPGWNKYSVAYNSDGFRAHNYPFTAASYGPPLKEGDVLGVGYRPRTGTVFFTRNGRKHEDAFVGLQRFNLFPTVGATGPATVHVNLGQAGFVFIEANVKKWGLAPSTGTLAPPPAYGSERGSILLEAGSAGANSPNGGGASPSGRVQDWSHGRLNGAGSAFSAGSYGSPASSAMAVGPSSGNGSRAIAGSSSSGAGHASPSRSRSHRSRRPKPLPASTTPIYPSPLRLGNSPSTVAQPPTTPLSPTSDSASPYVSPTDHEASPLLAHPPSEPPSPYASDDDASSQHSSDVDQQQEENHPDTSPASFSTTGSFPHNPPTPGHLDISLQRLNGDGGFFGSGASISTGGGGLSSSNGSSGTARPTPAASSVPAHARSESTATFRPPPTSRTAGDVSPPSYSHLDPVVYAAGVPTDLPAAMISAAFEAQERAEAEARARQTAADLEAQRPLGGRGRGVLGWLRSGGGSSESSTEQS